MAWSYGSTNQWSGGGGEVRSGQQPVHGQRTSWRYCLIMQYKADIRIKRALWSGWWMMIYVSCIIARWLWCWPHVSRIMFKNRQGMCLYRLLFSCSPSIHINYIWYLGPLSTVLLTEYVQTIRIACDAAQSFYSDSRRRVFAEREWIKKCHHLLGVFQSLIEWPWNKEISLLFVIVPQRLDVNTAGEAWMSVEISDRQYIKQLFSTLHTHFPPQQNTIKKHDPIRRSTRQTPRIPLMWRLPRRQISLERTFVVYEIDLLSHSAFQTI